MYIRQDGKGSLFAKRSVQKLFSFGFAIYTTINPLVALSRKLENVGKLLLN